VGTIGELFEALKTRLSDRVITIAEAAMLIGVCTTSVRRYVERGSLKCFRTPGNQRRFYLSEIQKFAGRQKQARAALVERASH